MDRAKELFLQYNGNQFYMDLDGDGNEYRSYNVPKETEEAWRREFLDSFFAQKLYGKEALKAYGTAVDFLKSDKSDEDWERFLYFPLRAEWLDDVTVLFMLRSALKLAEKWSKKGKLSKEEIRAYETALAGFTEVVQRRADSGALTRSEDYVMQEFSDPVYVESYLKDLKEKWERLS